MVAISFKQHCFIGAFVYSFNHKHSDKCHKNWHKPGKLFNFSHLGDKLAVLLLPRVSHIAILWKRQKVGGQEKCIWTYVESSAYAAERARERESEGERERNTECVYRTLPAVLNLLGVSFPFIKMKLIVELYVRPYTGMQQLMLLDSIHR